MLEEIVIIVICCLGIIFAYPLTKGGIPFILIVVMSPIIGGVIWFLVIIFSGLVNLPPSVRTVFFVCLLFTIIYLILTKGYKRWNIIGKELLAVGYLFIFIFATVFVVENVKDFLLHTGDSFLMIDMGRYWLDPLLEFDPADLPDIREKTLPNATHLPHMLNSYGFFIPAIQSARLFTERTIVAYVPILSTSFIFSAAILMNRLLALEIQFKKRCRLLLVSGTLLLILSNYAYLTHSRYLHSNLAAGAFLALSVLAYALYMREEKAEWLFMSGLLLFGLSFARVETPFYVLFISIFLILNSNIPTKLRRQVFSPVFLGIALWHILVFIDVQIYGSSAVEILTPPLLLFISGIFVGATIANYYLEKIPAYARLRAPQLLVAFLIVLALYTLNSQKGFGTLQGLLINIGYHRGVWGVYWYLIMGVLFVLPQRGMKTQYNAIARAVLIGSLLIVIASGFRGSYRVGWSDSGNRMLMHIFPLLTILLGLKIAIFLDKKIEKDGRVAEHSSAG